MMEEQKGKRKRLMENSEGTIVLEMNSEGELKPRIMRASEHMQNPHASLRIMSRGVQAKPKLCKPHPAFLCPLSVGLVRGSKPVPPV